MAQINTLGPVGYNPTGEYDNTHEYERLDVVYYEGSSYVALKDSIGQLPTNTEYWDCIAVGYLEQNIYDSVADMKADDTLKKGMYARTVGYYSANDGGGATYKITDTESQTDYQEEINDDLYANLIIENELNVKQFGAYGDGTHDDTTALNTALLFAINNNYSVYIPSGVFLVSSPLLIYGGGGGEKTFYLHGEGFYGSIIKSTSENTTNVIELKALDGNVACHINIKDLSVDGNTASNNGICITNDFTNSVLENIQIRNCVECGLTNDISGSKPNVYLDTFKKIRVGYCKNGIKIVAGNNANTSLNVQDCYVQGATNGYYFSAIYSTLMNCCADDISNYVFEFNYWNGPVINCATESQALQIFRFTHSIASVINPFAFGNRTDSNAIQILSTTNSHVTVQGGRLLAANNNVSTFPGKLYEIGNESSLELNNVMYNDYETKDPVNARRPLTSNNSYGIVSQRDSGRMSYIGRDTEPTNGYLSEANENNLIKTNAIYFGATTSPRYLDTGEEATDIYWSRHNVKGDIVLSNKPEVIGGIGWIQAHESPSQWGGGKYLKIPVIMCDNTANRPTGASDGQMYFDTTLNKPIWKKGSKWYDATGTEV